MLLSATAVLSGLAVLLPVSGAGAQTGGWGEAGAGRVSTRRGSTAERGRRTLPHANGREFRTLDAYLAHLRDYAGPTDRPWYREVGPGLYRLERGNYRGDTPPRLFTRDELERRFGFRR